jgi:hypothetical protein
VLPAIVAARLAGLLGFLRLLAGPVAPTGSADALPLPLRLLRGPPSGAAHGGSVPHAATSGPAARLLRHSSSTIGRGPEPSAGSGGSAVLPLGGGAADRSLPSETEAELDVSRRQLFGSPRCVETLCDVLHATLAAGEVAAAVAKAASASASAAAPGGQGLALAMGVRPLAPEGGPWGSSARELLSSHSGHVAEGSSGGYSAASPTRVPNTHAWGRSPPVTPLGASQTVRLLGPR